MRSSPRIALPSSRSPSLLLVLLLRRPLSQHRRIGGDRGADQFLERGLVDLGTFADVDRAAHIAVEARVEEILRIVERGAAREGELHDLLVGLPCAYNPVVGPDGDAPPFPFL